MDFFKGHEAWLSLEKPILMLRGCLILSLNSFLSTDPQALNPCLKSSFGKRP